jgi:hypothetical protein
VHDRRSLAYATTTDYSHPHHDARPDLLGRLLRHSVRSIARAAERVASALEHDPPKPAAMVELDDSGSW